ncbi:UNVERIFIED_CONTAM: hypothetical protein FKN15_006595 [Acipenser sinensis]
MGSMEYGSDAWYLISIGDTALHEEQKDHITGNGTSEKEPVEKNYIEDGKNIGNKNGKKGEGLMGSSFFTWFMIITLLGVWTSVAVVWFDLVDYEDVLGIPARAKDFRYNISEVLQDGKNIGNKNGKKGEGLMGSSFFTWFMIITLLGVWTSVAVVWFDLVDYEDVLGIPARAKDFRYNISEVLQGLSKDGSNVNLDSFEEVLNILAEEGSDWFYGFLTFLYDVMTPFEILEDEESETAEDVAEESVVQEEEVQQELTPEEKLLEEEQIPLQEAEEEEASFEELEEEEEEKTGHLVEAAEVLPPVEEEQEEEVEMLVAPLKKVEFPTEERVEEAAPTEEVGVEEAAPTEEERVEEEKVEEFPLEEESVEDEAAPSEEEKAEEMVEAAPLEQEMEEDAPLEQEMEEAISLEEAIIEEEEQVEDVSASMEEQYEEMEAQVGEADAEEERNEEKEESPGEEIAVETVFAEDPVEDATGEEVASEPEEEAPEQEEYTDSDPFPEDEAGEGSEDNPYGMNYYLVVKITLMINKAPTIDTMRTRPNYIPLNGRS